MDLFTETGKPLDSPEEQGVKLTSEDGEIFDNPKRYRRLVGKLNYFTVTRPNIAFPISVASQFMSSPKCLIRTQLFIYCGT